jgi:hypothetical protein
MGGWAYRSFNIDTILNGDFSSLSDDSKKKVFRVFLAREKAANLNARQVESLLVAIDPPHWNELSMDNIGEYDYSKFSTDNKKFALQKFFYAQELHRLKQNQIEQLKDDLEKEQWKQIFEAKPETIPNYDFSKYKEPNRALYALFGAKMLSKLTPKQVGDLHASKPLEELILGSISDAAFESLAPTLSKDPEQKERVRKYREKHPELRS